MKTEMGGRGLICQVMSGAVQYMGSIPAHIDQWTIKIHASPKEFGSYGIKACSILGKVCTQPLCSILETICGPGACQAIIQGKINQVLIPSQYSENP